MHCASGTNREKVCSDMRLIDSDKCPCRKCKISYCKSQCQTFYDWLDAPVEAEPVRHGKWEEFDCDYGDYCGMPSVGYYCSECGHAEMTKYPYCNCGAKMED